MNKKQFKKQVILEFKTNKNLEKKIDTIYGPLRLRFEKTERRQFFSCFMKFENFNDSKIYPFQNNMSGWDSFNTFSHKWNIHANNGEYLINEVKERLDNLEFSKNEIQANQS